MARAVTFDPKRRATDEPLYEIDLPTGAAYLAVCARFRQASFPMPLAERLAVPNASRAGGLHAILLGHLLGHDVAMVKKLHNIKHLYP